MAETVASQIWPHLPSDKSSPKKQEGGSIADAIWPNLAPKAPAPPNSNRERLLRGLRALNARLEGKR